MVDINNSKESLEVKLYRLFTGDRYSSTEKILYNIKNNYYCLMVNDWDKGEPLGVYMDNIINLIIDFEQDEDLRELRRMADYTNFADYFIQWYDNGQQFKKRK